MKQEGNGAPLKIDSHALAHRLQRKLKGEVHFDDGFRAMYATDGSNYRQTPIGVVRPRDEEDVLETFALCRQFGAPITSRGSARVSPGNAAMSR